MAADGFLPTDQSVPVGLFKSAFDNPLFIMKGKYADTFVTADGIGYPAKFVVFGKQAGAVNLFYGIRRQKMFHFIIYFPHNLHLIFIHRGPGITFLAAATLTFIQIADKAFVHHIFTHQYIIDYYQALKFCPKGTPVVGENTNNWQGISRK